MYYIIGDIHGDLSKLQNLLQKVLKNFDSERDTMLFLGDYIDRGNFGFETIAFLINLSEKINTVFLLGNHEDMFYDYIQGENRELFLYNGGEKTVRSYKRNTGSETPPESHRKFYRELKLIHEADDFVAAHAGLNPDLNICDQQKDDVIWIREKFYNSPRCWSKTVIFGHTPVSHFRGEPGIYFDSSRNIIGIDNGIIYGRPLACLRWPDKKVYYSGA
ncbi:MAG: serine/threonine protein phosphatase [Spirochaetia bacterium]|jgi:serine/threonine protein phosphatase 1|nr:serine/threonine protein phosphatase [Spirochaetia bacterium]